MVKEFAPKTAEKTVPDFNKYFYLNGLKVINPEAVNVIR